MTDPLLATALVEGACPAAALRPLRNRLPELLRAGILRRPHPGVYVDAARADDPLVRLRAAQLWRPAAVLIGRAARCAWGERLRLEAIDMAVSGTRGASPGVALHRLRVPVVHEGGGLRVPTPAWNAVWLAGFDGGEAIDSFLRLGGSLEVLHEELPAFCGTKGQRQRVRVVDASRDAPWSTGERLLHEHLRVWGLTGWRTNVTVATSQGLNPTVDVVFAAQRVIIEFDGWDFHKDRAAFEIDRRRSAELAADGWLVLRFTWRQLVDEPEWVRECLERALTWGDRDNGAILSTVRPADKARCA